MSYNTQTSFYNDDDDSVGNENDQPISDLWIGETNETNVSNEKCKLDYTAYKWLDCLRERAFGSCIYFLLRFYYLIKRNSVFLL